MNKNDIIIYVYISGKKIEKRHGSPIFKTRNFQLNIGEIRMYNPDGKIG